MWWDCDGCLYEDSCLASVGPVSYTHLEYSRLASNSVISARAMREIYLKAFEMVIKEADPWSIMTSYNFVNGTKAAELEPLSLIHI